MPVYICELCNYSTKIKTQLERHKNTKKHRNRCLGIDEQIVVYGGMKKKDPERPKRPKKTLSRPRKTRRTKKK